MYSIVAIRFISD